MLVFFSLPEPNRGEVLVLAGMEERTMRLSVWSRFGR